MSGPIQQPVVTVSDSTPNAGDTITISYSGPKPATWELVHEESGRDRNDSTLQFQRQYLQILAEQPSRSRSAAARISRFPPARRL